MKEARHAGYFYWPRVQVLLDGFKDLLKNDWDHVIHMSESDYPVHSMTWIRQSVAMQPQVNFIAPFYPKCRKKDGIEMKSHWYWWRRAGAVATCGSLKEPREDDGILFPTEKLEAKGFRFASAPEWMILTRELVEYATSPKLLNFRKMISMHSAADEIFWATLILNIPHFSQKISQQGWYQRWEAHIGHSPDILTESSFQHISQNRHNYFFIRKVDSSKSETLLRRMDDMLSSIVDDPGSGKALIRSLDDVVSCKPEGTASTIAKWIFR